MVRGSRCRVPAERVAETGGIGGIDFISSRRFSSVSAIPTGRMGWLQPFAEETGRPHRKQWLAEAVYSLPHCGQCIVSIGTLLQSAANTPPPPATVFGAV